MISKKHLIAIEILTLLLISIFIYSFIKNNNDTKSLVQTIMLSISLLVFLFIKNKELCISISLIIFSFVTLLLDTSSGYGAILIFCLVCIKHKTWINYLALSLFFIIIISIIINQYSFEKSSILLITHLLSFISIKSTIEVKMNKIKLNLTPDEEKILIELKKVKLQKCVTCFSKNIVSKKLKQATERNQLKSIGELTYIYSLQSDKSHY